MTYEKFLNTGWMLPCRHENMMTSAQRSRANPVTRRMILVLRARLFLFSAKRSLSDASSRPSWGLFYSVIKYNI